VAAVLPLREALSTPPLQGIRDEGPGGDANTGLSPLARSGVLAGIVLAAWALTRVPAWGDRPVAALASALLLISTLFVAARPLVTLLARIRVGRGSVSPLRVAQAALEAGRERAAWAAGAVAIAVALAIAMATMVGSFRATIIDWTAQAISSDLFLRALPNESGIPAGRLDPEIVDTAVMLFGREAVDPYLAAKVRFRGNRVSLGGAALDVVGRVGGVPFRDGRSSAQVLTETAARRGAIVDESFARRYGVSEGDEIEFSTPRGAVTRAVIGVYIDYGSHLGTIVLSRPDFLSLFPDEGAVSIAIFLGLSADPAAARARLLEALGGKFAFEVLLNREIRAEILKVFDNTFAVTTALQLVASAVAVIAVLTVLFALVRERRRDLGILRVLGASRAQVRGVVVSEAGLLAASGALGGLVVGLAVGYILVAVVNVQSFGWTIRFLPPWGTIVATALAVVPAGLLSGLLPAIAAARVTPREVLHEDG
jgi:putative ABC transport system permease protein